MIASFLEELKWHYTLRWVYASKYHETERGDKLTFHDKPFLKRLYLDQSEKIVIRKAVQVYCSVWGICEALSLAERGYHIFYVLPKSGTRTTFVSNRIDPALENIKYYKSLVTKARGSSDNTSLKHYGKAAIRFVYSTARSEFAEFPASAYIVDEFDYCDQENLRLADDRIRASEFRARRILGNPTLTDLGIDEEYENSDQKQWVVKCHRCNKWQTLDFFENVMLQTDSNKYQALDPNYLTTSTKEANIYCSSCHRSIDRFTDSSQWLPLNPGHPVSGYHLHHLMRVPHDPEERVIHELITEFMKAKNDPTRSQIFYNSRLGLGFNAEGTGLKKGFEKDLVIDVELPDRVDGLVMGVDVGSVLHCVIRYYVDDDNGITVDAVVSSWDELGKLIKRYGVGVCMIDHRPEASKAKEFQEDYMENEDCEVWLCTYYDTASRKIDIEPRIDHFEQEMTIHRTAALDAFIGHYTTNHMLLPHMQGNKEYLRHMIVPRRVLDEVKKITRWTKGTDHYFHAENYAYWAWMVRGYNKLDIR